MGRPACGIYEALWLARLHQLPVSGLYLHLPFCVRKCAYCNFSSWATAPDDPLVERYAASLGRLVEEAGEVGLLTKCETAYVGGGTPTLAGEGLARLVSTVRACAPRLRELTCEANPESLTDELLALLSEAGCTRLSIGVQSLDDAELHALGRIHDAARARERLEASVAAGFATSCDLMCAIPGQTDESWTHTVEEALSCGVGHVSVYPLQIEEGTPFDERYGDGDNPWNDPEVQASRMEIAARLLERARLARYEVASYAREGASCRHNQTYWTAGPYLGLGCHASSMLTREGYGRLREAVPRMPKAPDGMARARLTCTSAREEVACAQALGELSFEIEMLTEAQACAEDLMLAMRMTRGADVGLMEHARTVLGAAQVDEAFEECARRGLVRRQGMSWAPTHEGWLLGNELYGRLWDLAPGEVACWP